MFKKLLVFVSFFVLILFFADAPGIARRSAATGIVWEVYPTMSLAQIQGVVDNATNGDTIYFHAGTYDWTGAPLHPRYANEGTINIVKKTLTIMGEPGNLIIGPDSIGPAGTMEGANAFHVLDENLDNDVTFTGLNIQHFMRGIAAFHVIPVVPNVTELNLCNARNITIKNCSISDCARQNITIIGPMGNVLIQDNNLTQTNISIYLLYQYFINCPPDSDYWQPNQTSVVICGNKITSFNSIGIYAEKTKNFRVAHNTLFGTSPTSQGIYIYGTKKGTAVSSNSVTNCRLGIEINGFYAAPYNQGSDQVVLERNKLSCLPPPSQPNGRCYGILFQGDLFSGQEATKNEIEITSVNGIGIYSEAHHGYYAQNKVSGTGRYAVGLFNWDYSGGGGLFAQPHNEIFQANNVGHFTPGGAHFYLDYWTYDNLIFGSGNGHVTYEDYGTNNRIAGLMPMTGGIGQYLKEIHGEAGGAAKDLRKSLF